MFGSSKHQPEGGGYCTGQNSPVFNLASLLCCWKPRKTTIKTHKI